MPYLELADISPNEAPGNCTLGRLGALTVFTMYNTKTGETLTGTETQIDAAVTAKKQSLVDWEYKEGTEKKVDSWPKVVEGKTFGAKAFGWLDTLVTGLDPGAVKKSEIDTMVMPTVQPAQGMSPGAKNAIVIGSIIGAVGLGLLLFLKK